MIWLEALLPCIQMAPGADRAQGWSRWRLAQLSLSPLTSSQGFSMWALHGPLRASSQHGSLRAVGLLRWLQCGYSSWQGKSSITLKLELGSHAASFPLHYVVIGESQASPLSRGTKLKRPPLTGRSGKSHDGWRECWKCCLPQGASPVPPAVRDWPPLASRRML